MYLLTLGHNNNVQHIECAMKAMFYVQLNKLNTLTVMAMKIIGAYIAAVILCCTVAHLINCLSSRTQ